MTLYYVSITGLQVKSVWHFPRFGYYASQAMQQAQGASGNISANGNYMNGVHHTLSVWKDRQSMSRFMASGAHAKAMQISDEVSNPGSTKVYGYETDVIPTWQEAIALWDEHGKRHGKISPKETPSLSSSTTQSMGRALATTGFVSILLVAITFHLQHAIGSVSFDTVHISQ